MLLACMLLARVVIPVPESLVGVSTLFLASLSLAGVATSRSASASLADVPILCALTLTHACHFQLMPFSFRSYVAASCVLIYSSV